jgi:hypothetical protein
MLADNGFDLEHYHPSFFSSSYFAFFVPLYVVSLAFDLLRFILSIKNLSSFHLFVAMKR